MSILSLLFLFAEILMIGFASYMDVKYRRYPNRLFLMMSMCGLVYAFLSGHGISSFYFYVLVNLFGIFFLRPKLHIRAGDLKFFSTTFFLMDASNNEEMKLYILTLVVGMIVCAIFILIFHYKNLKQVLTHIHRELESISWLFLGYKDQAKIASESLVSDATVPFVAELGLITIVFIFLRW